MTHCICTSKVTKFKANNNIFFCIDCSLNTVFAQAKLLNLKQITTELSSINNAFYCICTSKVTKFKTNNNYLAS